MAAITSITPCLGGKGAVHSETPNPSWTNPGRIRQGRHLHETESTASLRSRTLGHFSSHFSHPGQLKIGYQWIQHDHIPWLIITFKSRDGPKLGITCVHAWTYSCCGRGWPGNPKDSRLEDSFSGLVWLSCGSKNIEVQTWFYSTWYGSCLNLQ